MIDLHSHILPGIDDGPGSIEQSLEMARLYAAAGFTRVVATPHFIPGTSWMPEAGVIREKAAVLNSAIKDHGIEIEVAIGMEVGLDNGVPGLLQRKEILTLGEGAYILLEVPFQRLPVGWEQIFFELASIGYRILLAHPERCDQVVRDNGLAEEFIHAGACLQVNFDSLLGNHGREIQETAFHLVEKGLIHCLATDSHENVHRNPKTAMQAIEMLQGRLGKANLVLLTRMNPKRVLDGMPLDNMVSIDARPGKKRWRWSRK